MIVGAQAHLDKKGNAESERDEQAEVVGDDAGEYVS